MIEWGVRTENNYWYWFVKCKSEIQVWIGFSVRLDKVLKWKNRNWSVRMSLVWHWTKFEEYLILNPVFA